MNIIYKKISIKEGLEHAQVLLVIAASCLVLGQLYKLIFYPYKLLSIIWVMLFLIFARLHYLTLKDLYYTFWTLTTISLTSFIYNIFNYSDDFKLLFLYGLGLLITLYISYVVSSPIYYPRVPWWEYDFRFRGDLKIKIIHNEEKIDGRLTDLRREAGCIVLFENLPIGQIINIESKIPDVDTVKAEIVTSRNGIIGRGYIYGVKFLNSNNFNHLEKRWKEIRITKKRLKFA